MDTNYPAGTPREGYPIEIQALWFAAVDFLAQQTNKNSWRELSEQIKQSIEKYYIHPEGWLSDCLHAAKDIPASKALQDDALRPNQLLAITLGAVENCEIRKNILNATSTLLIPGAIRTLADRPVKIPIPVKSSNGNLLNDPKNPYWGHYLGDEDTRRKPAYHNGTAWTWLFPSYSEAYYITYQEKGKQTAKAILSSSQSLLRKGCIGHIPEILDGDTPHSQRGCDAQAWGITELYRVWQKLI
jgi:glycogen debranching enzyme